MSGADVAAFASMLLPRTGGAFLGTEDWTLPAAWPDADAIVFGAGPSPAGNLGRASAAAARRETAIARLRTSPPAGFAVTRVHRLQPRLWRRGRVAAMARKALGSGALVELRRASAAPGRLSELAVDAGVADPRTWRMGPGGSASAFVDAGVLRAGLDAESVARAADGLRAAAAAGLPAPELVSTGAIAGVAWSLESLLTGQPPPQASASLFREVATRWTTLPESGGPPAAPAEDLDRAAAHLPHRSAALHRAASRCDDALADATGVLRHGDCWAGNLLVARGRLTGIVDWDNWHRAAAAGADILQLVVTEDRHRRGRSLGAAWLERPWRDEDVRALLAVAGVDISGDEEAATALGVAWWATEVRGTLDRDPSLAADDRWVSSNVDAVLDALDYS